MNHKQLVQQMTEMKAQLENYQSELSYLRNQVTNYENVETPIPVAGTTSRRKLLKRMAIAGIGGIGAISLAAATNPNYTVLAENTAENAIEAVGGTGGYGLRASGGLAPLFLAGAGVGVPGTPTSGAHQAGELYVDSAGTLYYCVTSGTPGTWRSLSSSSSQGSFHGFSRGERYVDTRAGALNVGGVTGPVPAGWTHTYQLTGHNGKSGNSAFQIPTGSTAVTGNIFVLGPATAGYLSVAAGGTDPNTLFGSATLAYNGGADGGTSFTASLDSSGSIIIGSSSATQITLDITGYYS